MASIWTLESEFPQMETLKEDKSTQVVVIGAGMVGLLTAYLLHQEIILMKKYLTPKGLRLQHL